MGGYNSSKRSILPCPNDIYSALGLGAALSDVLIRMVDIATYHLRLVQLLQT